jgi:hypothetical protein
MNCHRIGLIVPARGAGVTQLSAGAEPREKITVGWVDMLIRHCNKNTYVSWCSHEPFFVEGGWDDGFFRSEPPVKWAYIFEDVKYMY